MAFANGGAVGSIQVETISIQDEASPTTATCFITYLIAGEGGQLFAPYAFNTNSTAATIRSGAKDAVQAHVLETFGFTMPKAMIKMLNAPE
jgi:hypothetical protein